MSARLARASWVVSVLLALATFTLLVLSGDDTEGETVGFDFLLAVALLVYPTVGVLIASRRPENAIGWLFCAVGIPLGLSTFAYAYATYALVTKSGSLPGGTVAAWLTNWVELPALFGTPTLLVLLFPDGRLPSRRWRPVLWLTAAAMLGLGAAPALQPGPMTDAAVEGTVNPVGIPGAGPVLDDVAAAAGAAALLSMVLAVIALALRFRRSRGVERLQLKWFVSAAVLFVLVCVGAFLVFAENVVLFGMLVIGAFAAIPISAGVAILRYRLYDIDVVINRALVYGALTVMLGATYLASVLLVGLAVGRSGFAVAVSTLAVAALFRPLRARIQGAVDRRFYRRRYDAAMTLESFGAHLRDELDLETLTADIRAVVHDTVQPAHVSVWLR